MTRTARQDARRWGKEDAVHSLLLGGCLFGFYGEHNSKIRKGSCRDVTWRGLVVKWSDSGLKLSTSFPFWGGLRVHRAFVYSDSFVCYVCFCSLLPRLTLLLSFLGHPALPPPRGGSASRVSPQSCQSHESLAYDTHACCARSNDHLLWLNPICARIG